MPVLTLVGDDWHQGRTRIAHEHLMSSTMRNLLGAFLRLYARRDASVRLLFATPSGERHEIATLGAAMLAASAGLGVSYLGADLPAREIVDSVEPAGAQVLVLGLTTAGADKARDRELKTIVRDLPDSVELWAGGRGAERHASNPAANPLPEVMLDAHDLSPGGVMSLVPTLGGSVGRIIVVGCQPASLEEGIGLSDEVRAAVEPAAALVARLVEEELDRLRSKRDEEVTT